MGRIEELDFRENDIVQVHNKNKMYNGQLGKIIGVTYLEGRGDNGFFSYTVQFSDKESRAFVARDLRKIRGNYERGRKDITYETR